MEPKPVQCANAAAPVATRSWRHGHQPPAAVGTARKPDGGPAAQRAHQPAAAPRNPTRLQYLVNFHALSCQPPRAPSPAHSYGPCEPAGLQERMRSAVALLGEKEVREIIDQQGKIEVRGVGQWLGGVAV